MFEKITAAVAFLAVGLLLWWLMSDVDARNCQTAIHRIDYYVPCITNESCRLTATEYNVFHDARRKYRECARVE